MDRTRLKNRVSKILKCVLPVLLAFVLLSIYVPVHAQLELPSLIIKFEPSGTHVDTKGNLKIRLDFYPTLESKSYEMYHVYVIDETSPEYLAGYKGELDKDGKPIDEKDYQTWLDLLPHIWRTNPCLSHFVTVPADINKANLDSWVKATFYSDVTATIDNAMIQINSAHLISPYMRDKSSTTTVKLWDDTAKMTPILSEMVTMDLLTTSEASSLTTAKSNPEVKTKVDSYVVEKVNVALSDFSIASSPGGTIEDIQPQSIDVGPGAIDRTSVFSTGFTAVDKANPANADGTLDVIETWFATDGAGVKIGTFYASGAQIASRDYENIGNVASGSKQTFSGLNCDVITDDWIGVYGSSGGVEYTNNAGVNLQCKSGDYFGATTTYTNAGARQVSLYATGTEAGGGWTTIGKVNGVGSANVSKINGVDNSSIGKLNGITP